MKAINTYLFESSIPNKDKFTKEELYKDYENVDGISGQGKKDLITKYGITTKKTQDIKNKILLILREIRNEKKTFDDQDIIDFLRLHDYVTSRMIEGLKDEPKEFSTNLKEYYFNRLKSRKLDQYALSTSLSSYRFSIADKDLIKTYQKIAKAADEINPTKEKLNEKEHFEMLNNRITELMQDFKVTYLKRIEEYAKNQYKYYSNEHNLDILNKGVKDAEAKLEKYKEDNNIRWIKYNDYKGNALQKDVEKAKNKVAQFKAFIKMYSTEKVYLDKCRKDGEETFAHNIGAISERLIKDKLNIDNLSISDIKNDPKFFEMIITDGTKKLYLRSVFAAQFSDKMIPHFRFIITERK